MSGKHVAELSYRAPHEKKQKKTTYIHNKGSKRKNNKKTHTHNTHARETTK